MFTLANLIIYFTTIYIKSQQILAEKYKKVLYFILENDIIQKQKNKAIEKAKYVNRKHIEKRNRL